MHWYLAPCTTPIDDIDDDLFDPVGGWIVKHLGNIDEVHVFKNTVLVRVIEYISSTRSFLFYAMLCLQYIRPAHTHSHFCWLILQRNKQLETRDSNN